MTTPIETAFQYCPRCGIENPSPGAVPFRCDQCDMALFFGPVAAVGGLIVNEAGQLLLVQRARNPGKGKWGLPGGFVDRGESIEQALLREIQEETQLSIDRMTLIFTHPNQYNYRGVTAPVIDLFYECHATNVSHLQLAADELQDHTWVIPTDQYLDHMAFDSNRLAIEHWLDQTA